MWSYVAYFLSMFGTTVDNPYAGRVICGNCGSTFGRKIWNSTNGGEWRGSIVLSIGNIFSTN